MCVSPTDLYSNTAVYECQLKPGGITDKYRHLVDMTTVDHLDVNFTVHRRATGVVVLVSQLQLETANQRPTGNTYCIGDGRSSRVLHWNQLRRTIIAHTQRYLQ